VVDRIAALAYERDHALTGYRAYVAAAITSSAVLGQNSISQPSTTRVLESATSAIALQDGSGQGIATERSVNGSPVQKSLARARITFQSLATSKLNDSGYAARRT